MSLDYTVVSADMVSIYDTLKNDTQQDNPNQTPYPKNPGTQWMDAFKTNYDSYAIAGTMTAGLVTLTSQPSLLDFSSSTLGTVISAYWSAQTTPAGSAVSCTNDASKIAIPIDNYLAGLGTMAESTPHYEHLFSFIETQVKTIVWTCALSGGGSSPDSVT